MKQLGLALRSTVFYLVYVIATAWWGFTSPLLFWLPYKHRAPYVLLWNRFVVWWFSVCCGVKITIELQGELPTTAVVIVSNHQSNWETYFLQNYCRPVATILKRELLNIPGFGWGLRMMKPIAIDRSTPREAMRQMLRQGQQRLADGLSVLVFPEGSRHPAGSRPKFARGAAGLATSAGCTIVPIAHNAGNCWPPRKFLKYPGTITVIIGPAIDTQGKSPKDITEQTQAWIFAQLDRLESTSPN